MVTRLYRRTAMTAPLWITGPPTPAIEGRCGGPVPHSSYTTQWDTTEHSGEIARFLAD